MIKKLLFIAVLFPIIISAQEESKVDIVAKQRNAELLVKKAVELIAFHPFSQAIDAFLTDISWRKGELAISLIDNNGYIILDALDSTNIWTKIENFEEIKERSKDGGGWVLYTKNGRVFSAYVEQIRKDDLWYFVHTGFFSYAAEDKVVYLVNKILKFYDTNKLDATVKLINESKLEAKAAFFPFICDTSGVCLAYERYPQHIGKKIFNGQANTPLEDTEEEERDLLEQILDLINSPNEGGWIDYVHNGGKVRSYIHKLGPDHFIGASYFPGVSQDTAINLVHKAVQHMRSFGPQETFKELNERYDTFGKGGLEVVIFDMEGVVFAAPYHPQWIGKSIYNLTYERNNKIVQAVLRELQHDYTSWTSFVNQQQTWTVYSERIDTTEGTFAITCAFNVHTKEQAVETLILQAVDFFSSNTPTGSFAEFSAPDSEFKEADIDIFIYDMNGTCLVNGSDYNLIWQNLLGLEDQRGVYIIADLINTANLADQGWRTFAINNETRRVLINHLYETIPSEEEEGLQVYRSYVIGAGYYL